MTTARPDRERPPRAACPAPPVRPPVAPAGYDRRAGLPVTAGRAAALAQIQRAAGNRAVGRLLPARAPDRAPVVQRCGDDQDCGCTAGTGPVPVQRDFFGDAVDGVADLAGRASSAVSDAADTAGAAVSDAADTAGAAVSDAADTAGAAVSGVRDTAGSAASAVVDAAAGAVDPAITEALGSASSLAASWGGTVSLVGSTIVITLPHVSVTGPQTVPFGEIPVPPLRLPFLPAAAAIGPVELVADLALEVAIHPEAVAVVGPVDLRGVRIELNPLGGSYTATGQLHAAGSSSMLVAVAPGLDLQVLGVIMIGEVPIPVEADVLGGLRLTLRGSGVGSVDETVTLGYRRGGLFLDSLTDIRLGGRVDAELDAGLEVAAYGQRVCQYTWPLGQWLLAENAEQYTAPLSIGYHSEDGAGFSAGPWTSRPIPVGDIEATLPTLPRHADCASFDRLITVLCAKGIIPPELCALKGHGGGAEFGEGPVGVAADGAALPAAPSLRPGSTILVWSTGQAGGRPGWFRGEVVDHEPPPPGPDTRQRMLTYRVDFPDQPVTAVTDAKAAEEDMERGLGARRFRRYEDPVLRETLKPFLAHPLLNVGKNGSGSVPATGPAVTGPQRQRIHDIGESEGCHVERTHSRGAFWVADHQRPTKLREHGLVETSPWDLYPMCVADSNAQGPLVSRIVRMYTGRAPT